jgi:hypothetical protein
MIGIVTIAFVQTYALYGVALQFGWHCPDRYSMFPFAQPYVVSPENPAGQATVAFVSCSIFGTITFDPVQGYTTHHFGWHPAKQHETTPLPSTQFVLHDVLVCPHLQPTVSEPLYPSGHCTVSDPS